MIKFAIVVCFAACVAADAKADADADPALLYSAYGYGYGYPYTYGLRTYTPYTYAHHAVAPVLGARYYANSGGAVHIVKRDADAEPTADADADADADAYYGFYRRGYYGYPYAYRSYGY